MDNQPATECPQETLASGRPKRQVANVHPGRIILDSQPRRQTSTEKEANNERTREALAKKVAALKRGYQQIGKIEDEMEVNQSGVAAGTKPIKPCPHPHPRTVGRQRNESDGGMNEPLTPLADMEDNAEPVVMKGKGTKAAKAKSLCEAIISTRNKVSPPSTCDNSISASTGLMCILLLNMFLLTEATLFFANVLTTASSDDKLTLSKRVKNWVNIIDTSSTRSSSASASPRTSAAPPPSTSTLATSTTNVEFRVFNLSSPLPNDPQYNYKFKSQLPENFDLLPDRKDGEASGPVRPLALDVPTLQNSQCTAAMAKDYEANDPATRLANVKRKVAELEYVSTSEVEGNGVDDNCDNLDDATRVLGHKNAVAKSHITVTKGMPKKIKIQACDSMSSLSATSTSKRSIVASDSLSQVQTVPAQVHFNNSDLPSDLHKDQKWKREVIPTLILWAGNQEDAFNITKQDICRALQEIMPVIYPILKNMAGSILPSSPMVSVASQCLCDWRHGFASAAIVQLIAFFLNPQDPLPADTAKVLLDHFTFLYEDLDMTVPEKAFCSIFVQQLLLSSHLTATKGYVQVPTLDTSSLAKHGVVGALGLCAAVLSRGLNLVRSGDIKLKSPVNVKDGIAKVATRFVWTPVKYNMASGKDSKTACAFSDQNWGAPTRKFMGAAKRRSIAQLQAIVELTLASLAIGQELDPELLSDAGSDDKYALICPGPINPKLSGMASGVYLLEEKIEGGHAVFKKFIHNMDCGPSLDEYEDGYDIAEFLAFTQHVQYTKTGGLTFISDYQGKCTRLI
ncbi:hypothetical protein M404DRAFT_22387 [Pisolithus tinctorius Marx 270]|uniref:Alpha-type protein kinase domain-containing protein n=1 Tax=Pisolithus tinctorius Marx 270 TaxID=870435 RepID=A0A0C3JJC1_PISTI|nr:hypothetical protein M404DRAFT_22387 [Pisolithus tinctorius Marx 270]